jgi:hypothetical protein
VSGASLAAEQAVLGSRHRGITLGLHPGSTAERPRRGLRPIREILDVILWQLLVAWEPSCSAKASQ